MILLNLELFLLTLRREREEKADDSKRFELTEETAHLKSSRLIQVVHYMQEHVQEQIDMNTLCDVFYMSRSTLQHLFHKEFGCGPMEYFSRMKIRRAREMMREENCNITEIAARLSYGSVQYFSRQFKKEMGISFSQYILNLKIDKAKNLLRFSEYSIGEITYYLGFSNESHFIQTFQKRVGETPNRYRRRCFRTEWELKQN